MRVYTIWFTRSSIKTMSSLKNKLFQVRKFLAIALVIFSAPVFSLNSYTDNDKYTASFSAEYSSAYSIDKCFDGSNTSGTCASIQGGTMSIIFKESSDITNLNLILASTSHIYDYLEVDGTRYEYELSGIYNFLNVTNITVFSKSTSFVYLKEIIFDFETVVTDGNGNNNNISEGVNWSMFSYSFTIVGVLALFGRGVKAVLDIVKYG